MQECECRQRRLSTCADLEASHRLSTLSKLTSRTVEVSTTVVLQYSTALNGLPVVTKANLRAGYSGVLRRSMRTENWNLLASDQHLDQRNISRHTYATKSAQKGMKLLNEVMCTNATGELMRDSVYNCRFDYLFVKSFCPWKRTTAEMSCGGIARSEAKYCFMILIGATDVMSSSKLN